jgi:hypothetical protein
MASMTSSGDGIKGGKLPGCLVFEQPFDKKSRNLQKFVIFPFRKIFQGRLLERKPGVPVFHQAAVIIQIIVLPVV